MSKRLSKKDIIDILDNKSNIIVIGPNGSGKSTFISEYSRLKNEKYHLVKIRMNTDHDICFLHQINIQDQLINRALLSEGQTLLNGLCFQIGKKLKSIKSEKPIVLCIDEFDSGLSINVMVEVLRLILEVYPNLKLIVASNSYEVIRAFEINKTSFSILLVSGSYKQKEGYYDYRLREATIKSYDDYEKIIMKKNRSQKNK